MSLKHLFKKELIDLDLALDKQSVFFEIVGNELNRQNLVDSSFTRAIIEREQKYPTGLQLKDFAIAIPHTDAEYIIEPFVAVKRLEKEIDFYQMGTDDQIVKVRDIIILGIKEPKKQVGLLATLMTLFTDESFTTRYQAAKTVNDLYSVLITELQKMEEIS